MRVVQRHGASMTEPVIRVVKDVGDDLMAEAWGLTTGDRNAQYGRAEDVFEEYAMAWTAVLRARLKPGEAVSAADVAIMMTMLKILRETRVAKRDNVVDAHGYLSLLARIRGWVKL